MGPRLREDKRGHPHPFDKPRAGSGILPSKEEKGFAGGVSW